jgi:chemotaxis response regulator CheB
MTTLIVSASAVLRSTLKDLLSQIPGQKTVLETGNVLQVERLLAEKQPRVVFWDESMGEETAAMIRKTGERGSFHLVLLVSPSNLTGPDVSKPNLTKMEKVDFSTGSVLDYSQAQKPRLTLLFEDLERRQGVSGREETGGSLRPVRLVVIGASTGGPAAIRKVLETLPETFSCPIALVQHIDSGYEAGYAAWLKENTRLNVRLARNDDAPRPGEVIVAPTDFHLVCRDERFFLDDGPKVFSQKPAVDRLFSSAAPVYAGALVGILLTGIGSDGAQGCREILDCGGLTLVQDEATSTVWGMPKAAWELHAASLVLPLPEIGPRLIDIVRSRSVS